MLPHHFGAFCCHPTELRNISYSISALSLTPSPVFPHHFLLLVHSVSHVVDEHCWHNKGWYVSMHECSQATGMETGMSGEGGRQRWMRGENEEVNNEKEIGWGQGAGEEGGNSGNTNADKDRDKDEEGARERTGDKMRAETRICVKWEAEGKNICSEQVCVTLQNFNTRVSSLHFTGRVHNFYVNSPTMKEAKIIHVCMKRREKKIQGLFGQFVFGTETCWQTTASWERNRQTEGEIMKKQREEDTCYPLNYCASPVKVAACIPVWRFMQILSTILAGMSLDWTQSKHRQTVYGNFCPKMQCECSWQPSLNKK